MKYTVVAFVGASGSICSDPVVDTDGLTLIDVSQFDEDCANPRSRTQVKVPLPMAMAMMTFSAHHFHPLTQVFHVPFGRYSNALRDFGVTTQMNLYLLLEPLGAFHGLNNIHINPHIVMSGESAALHWFVRTSMALNAQVLDIIKDILNVTTVDHQQRGDMFLVAAASVDCVTKARGQSESIKGNGRYEYVIRQPITGPRNPQNPRILTEILTFPVRF